MRMKFNFDKIDYINNLIAYQDLKEELSNLYTRLLLDKDVVVDKDIVQVLIEISSKHMKQNSKMLVLLVNTHLIKENILVSIQSLN